MDNCDNYNLLQLWHVFLLLEDWSVIQTDSLFTLKASMSFVLIFFLLLKTFGLLLWLLLKHQLHYKYVNHCSCSCKISALQDLSSFDKVLRWPCFIRLPSPLLITGSDVSRHECCLIAVMHVHWLSNVAMEKPSCLGWKHFDVGLPFRSSYNNLLGNHTR